MTSKEAKRETEAGVELERAVMGEAAWEMWCFCFFLVTGKYET